MFFSGYLYRPLNKQLFVPSSINNDTKIDTLCISSDNVAVTHFTILGERCSGTHYIEHLIKANFDLHLTWKYGYKDKYTLQSHKHFFQFSDDYTNSKSKNCLFVCIVRDPYEWLYSLYTKRYHLNNRMFTDDWQSYLSAPFYSVYDNKKIHPIAFGKERMGDRHIYTGKRYKNIFEARAIKAKFMLDELPKLVQNVVVIRYEDARDNPATIINLIASKFNIKRKGNDVVPIESYKGQQKNKFVKVEYFTEIPEHYKNMINTKIDWDIENRLGYYLNQTSGVFNSNKKLPTI